MDARSYLTALYLDWRNNYLSTALFAEHHGLTEQQAAELLALACKVFSSQHPEA